jgi:hypothetical protein
MKPVFLAAAFGLFVLAACSKAGADSVPKDYPLKNCVISGEELGSGGMVPFKMTHEGTDVWLCCKHCDKKFLKEPAKFVQMVKDASAKKK